MTDTAAKENGTMEKTSAGPPMTDTAKLLADIDAEIMAADWHDLPKGHYAVPVYDFADLSDPDDEGTIVGYQLYQRITPTVCKNGRVVGRNGFRYGAVHTAPGVTPQRVRDVIALGGSGEPFDRQLAIWTLLVDVDQDDTYRPLFGQVTGRCGCCGRALTDPESKMRGIGPECIKMFRPAIKP